MQTFPAVLNACCQFLFDKSMNIFRIFNDQLSFFNIAKYRLQAFYDSNLSSLLMIPCFASILA